MSSPNEVLEPEEKHVPVNKVMDGEEDISLSKGTPTKEEIKSSKNNGEEQLKVVDLPVDEGNILSKDGCTPKDVSAPKESITDDQDIATPDTTATAEDATAKDVTAEDTAAEDATAEDVATEDAKACSKEDVGVLPVNGNSSAAEEATTDEQAHDPPESHVCTNESPDKAVVVESTCDNETLIIEDNIESDGKVENNIENSSAGEPLRPTKEMEMIGAEIIFLSDRTAASLDGWTNMKWLSTNGERKLRHCGLVYRLATNCKNRKGLFSWGNAEETYVPRRLAIFEEPSLILVLRQPSNAAEVRQLLDVTDNADLGVDSDAALTDGYLVAETVIEPKTCKLRLSPLTTCTSVESTASEEQQSDDKRKSCFELLTPFETIVLSAAPARAKKKEVSYSDSVQFLETSILEVAVGKELYMAHCPPGEDEHTDVAWKHQIILGTLHSFVVCGNQSMLEKALEAAINANDDDVNAAKMRRVPSRVIDAQDESCRTALHYALIRRSSAAVSALAKAGANCTVPINPDDTSPCHFCARNLDDKSLSMILSASYPSRPDPNVLNNFGQTPSYVASIEGRSKNGHSDPVALGRCLAALEAWGGQMILEDEQDIQPLRHPVSELASLWRPEELTVVFAHVSCRYPFHTSDTPDEKVNMSLSAAFHYPVHSALITIRNEIQIIKDGSIAHQFGHDEVLRESKLVSTLRVLFEHGFEPNERLEGVIDDFYGADHLASYVGYSPIQILGSAALAANHLSLMDKSEDKGDNKEYDLSALKRIMGVISSAALFLLENGARLNLDAPTTTRLDRKPSSRSLPEKSNDSKDDQPDHQKFEVDRSKLKIESNKTLMKLFGGDERIKAAKNKWSGTTRVENGGKMNICREQSKVTLTDEEAPGGNDEKSCSICWRAFGKLVNRKHRCRVTKRYVCDECSTRRIVDSREEYRVSDGQFLLAKVDAAKEVAKKLEEKSEKERVRRAQAEKLLNERRNQLSNKNQSDEANRDSLFGGVMEKATSFVFGDDDEDGKEGIEDKVGGLTNSLGQTKDALNERGDKLNSLADKTDRLLDASRDFANMAKQLERQQNSWW